MRKIKKLILLFLIIGFVYWGGIESGMFLERESQKIEKEILQKEKVLIEKQETALKILENYLRFKEKKLNKFLGECLKDREQEEEKKEVRKEKEYKI